MPCKRLTQAERRRQIIDVAMRLFAVKGFKGATTRAIAKAAGVSEAIIFRHFETKEDLYDAIIDTTLEKRRELWEKDVPAIAEDEDLESLLVSYGETFLRRHREDPTFIRLMMYSALEDHKFRQRFFEASRSPYMRAIRRRIDSGRARGEFRDVDAELAAKSFLWVLLQYCVNRFVATTSPPDEAQDRTMVRHLADLFVAGIRARAGAPSAP